MDVGRPIKSPVIATILRLSLLFGIIFLPGRYVLGQVKFTTVVSSQTMGKSDYLQVEFIVENAREIADLTPPEFPGFRIAQGPIQSSGMSVVNGNMSQYKALSFVLEPTRVGAFKIGGAVATVDGKHMHSNTVSVVVHPGGSGSANTRPSPGGGNPFMQPAWPDPFGHEPGEVERDYVLKPGENVKEKIRKNLFVKVQVDKNTCYVGEPIVATYKLYSRLSSESRVTKRPSLNGFSVYDMIDPSADAVSVEKLNGKDYTVHIIRKTQLIPLQSGSIDLDPVEVENTVHFVKGSGRQEQRRSGNSLRDLLDQMNDESNLGPEVDENVTLDTKPVTITVKPLPEENKPAAYGGAVGNFSVEASLGNNSVAAQDEATLHLVVKGKGNLPVIAAPPVAWPDSIRAFDPTSKEDVNKTVAPMTGTKSFDYIFTPRSAGHYTIPAVIFSYFDPTSQTYKTAETRPLDLQVSPAVRKGKQRVPGEAAEASGRLSPLSAGLSNFIQEHLEWIFAALLVAGVTIYFWRQNSRLKRQGAGKKAAVAPADEPTTGQQEIAEGRFSGRQAEGRKAAEGSRNGDGRAGGEGRPGGDGRPAGEGRAGGEGRAANEGRPGGEGRPGVPPMAAASYVPATPVVDPLLEAKQYFEKGDPKAFYREINRALWRAMSKKLDLPASELNKFNTVRQLRLRGWDETSLLSLENVLNECEMNLYTPAYDRFNMELLLRQTERLLDRMA